jgi:intraflagellar transport protein 172
MRRGGLPAKAATVVLKHNQPYDNALLDSICAALARAGLYERAGDVLEHLNRNSDAKDAYRKCVMFLVR